MSVMRFTGVNSREAMRQVRAALGDDALILANRRTDQGIEILAMAEPGAEPATPVPPARRSATPDAPERPSTPRRPSERRSSVPLSSGPPAAAPSPAAPSPAAPAPDRPRRRPADAPAAISGPEAAGPHDAFEAMSARLLQEMQEMRDLLAARAPATATPPQRERLIRWLEEAGFSRTVVDEALSALPVDLEQGAEAAWLIARLAARLPVQEDELALLDRGGIVALVGPTGVGKTTTAAKLAARFVMRHGPEPVALVSTDGFRVGAHEQLRIYAELLGIPMHGLELEQSLESLLPSLAGKRFVIIDTVGMSQRDRRIIDQIARLQGGAPVRPVLLLNAASQPETLEEVVVNYRQAVQAAGLALEDCVISKQDEAGRLGPLLDALMRHGLRLLFVAHGQRVPEDLAVGDPAALVEQALAVRSRAPRSEPPAGAALLLGRGRRLAALLVTLRERVPGFEELERAWALAGVPPSLQPQRLEALMEQALPPSAGRIWMSRARVRGEAWSQPDLCLDHDGQWSALPRLQHLAPPGEVERLAWAESTTPLGAHLMVGLPGDDSRRWLAEQGRDWVALVRGGLRVEAAGERRSITELKPAMAQRQPRSLRWRSRDAQLRLAACAVTLGGGEPLRAWAGELVDAFSGKVLKRAWWLAPDTLRGRAVPLLLAQLSADALPLLTRRAIRRLAEADADMSPSLRLTLGAGLAAVAVQLETSDEAWAPALRGELLGLLAGKRRSSAETLLDALLHLGLAREALRELGTVGQEGLH